MGFLDGLYYQSTAGPVLSSVFPKVAGWYWVPVGAQNTSTTAILGNGSLRMAPFYVPDTITIDRLGGEITVIGEAGSTVRFGIYRADNRYLPLGAPVAEGTILGDSATVQDATVNTVLTPGLYYGGAAVQGAPSTQPTVRIVAVGAGIYFSAFTAQPTANQLVLGVTVTGVTAALPTLTTGSTVVNGQNVPRFHMRLA